MNVVSYTQNEIITVALKYYSNFCRKKLNLNYQMLIKILGIEDKYNNSSGVNYLLNVSTSS